MANVIWLISAAGTNYYLNGGGEYNGSGTPWTTSGGSPYEIALNDVTGERWTPKASLRQEVYGGGPPFRIGQSLIYNSYGNAIEAVPIQMRATSHDNAVKLLQQLRQILNTALFTLPCVLAVQPNGATNVIYYEIYGADVQEDPRFINDEAGIAASGHAVLRAVVTIRRSPHGALITTGETALNNLTFTNTGTGSNNDTQAFTTGLSGDLINEGQPMNLVITPASAGASVRRTYLGSVLNRTYSTTGAAALSTTSTTGADLATLASWTMTDKLTNRGIKPRVILRFSTAPTAKLLLRLKINLASSTQAAFFTPWVSAREPIQDEQHKLVDMGTFPVEILRRNGAITTPSAAIVLQGKSTDGTSATATLGYSEYIWYYDWARIDTLISYDANGTHKLFIDQYQEVSGAPCVPHPNPAAFAYSSASAMVEIADVRGRLPRYFAGASLYLAWVNTSGNHTTSHTSAVTARVAPQWGTLRGAD